TGVPRGIRLGFCRWPGLRQEAVSENSAAILSRHGQNGFGSLPAPRSAFSPRSLGAQPLGTRRPHAHVCGWADPDRNSADVSSYPYQTGRCGRILAGTWGENCPFSLGLLLSIKLRGRKLLVGCPVVASFLPREWSCWYRRSHPSKCFSSFENSLWD